jgi:hypothetical protein
VLNQRERHASGKIEERLERIREGEDAEREGG